MQSGPGTRKEMSEKQITARKCVQRKVQKHKKGARNPVQRRTAIGNHFGRSELRLKGGIGVTWWKWKPWREVTVTLQGTGTA